MEGLEGGREEKGHRLPPSDLRIGHLNSPVNPGGFVTVVAVDMWTRTNDLTPIFYDG